MIKHLLSAALLAGSVAMLNAQCTINNATSCACKNGSTDCDLLPNITLADEPLLVAGNNGVIEYSQTGNGVENGRLRVSVSTPNIGHGPLTVRASQIFLCGTDTFYSNPGTCPSGGSPRQLIFQRIYHKNGSTMTYWDRPAGSMTYHPTHQHMHVDDWGEYTLRKRDTTQPNPLLWPIIGTGAKLGFCLMDYGTCSYYNGHCEDSLGNTLTNSSFPNFGLGGGNYNCSPTEQGISSGYTDIYYQYLDGMYIQLPPTTCNGDYYIVVHIDPHNYFLEEKEDDNVIAIPYTITKQIPNGNGVAQITYTGSGKICENNTITLTASNGSSYLWNTGDTTKSISISTPGDYTVQVTSDCGVASSSPVTITVVPNHVNNISAPAVCKGEEVTITANGTGVLHWSDAPTGGNELNIGNSYSFTSDTSVTLYVVSEDTLLGLSGSVGPVDNTFGNGSYYSNDQHQEFDVFKPIRLKTVKVYANSTKNRIIELRNSSGAVLQSKTVNISQGTQVVTLNFDIQPGPGYQLGWLSGSQPDLFRNSTGASYPYTLNGLITITGNSANDPVRWYCYYDWQVEEIPITCRSAAMFVNVAVQPVPLVAITGVDSTYLVTDAPIVLTGSPSGGTFSGTGVSGNTFSPALAGVGGPYTLTYSYTDSIGCSAEATVQVTVKQSTPTGAQTFAWGTASLYPNPAGRQVNIRFSQPVKEALQITLLDVAGRKVREYRNVLMNTANETTLYLNGLASGIYTLQLSSGVETGTYRLEVR